MAFYILNPILIFELGPNMAFYIQNSILKFKNWAKYRFQHFFDILIGAKIIFYIKHLILTFE